MYNWQRHVTTENRRCRVFNTHNINNNKKCEPCEKNIRDRFLRRMFGAIK